ncbi:DNA-binding GntR family transcriptional regulator [Limibacillus halophilus]|uniref:DNA-binding GntR family transcriptional regulator n=2 Tax=Limibacillus halophilus TaxID=1579333 RepID=A0A839SNM4_9PROT|nr:DNA-binding GntR family transcriptional regulator [Limibacillus halophilus]
MERSIAQELGVSRTPVREALFTLQGEGLVELVPRRYARVRRITRQDIAQIYSMRLVLETHAARSAALYADRDAILNIEVALLRQESLDTSCSALEQANADLAFHAAVTAAAGSQVQLTIINHVLAMTATLRSRIKYEGKRAKMAVKQHREVLKAIKASDADKAGELMKAHIEWSTANAREMGLLTDPDSKPTTSR